MYYHNTLQFKALYYLKSSYTFRIENAFYFYGNKKVFFVVIFIHILEEKLLRI